MPREIVSCHITKRGQMKNERSRNRKLFTSGKDDVLLYFHKYKKHYIIDSMAQHQNTPQFIKQIPWYASKEGKTSNSTEIKSEKTQSQDWYDRGSKGFQANTFRKGACQNCGAMGHNRKECTERPRKIAAKFSCKAIAADDVTKDLNLSWEGKRDRWNGYNS